MIALRAVLFLGLVGHKLLWEVMKRKSPLPGERMQRLSPLARLAKAAKLLMLGFFLLQTLLHDLLPIADDALLLRAIGMVIFLGGLGTAVAGRLQLGENWADIEDGSLQSQHTLITSGIYAYIRHPIYTGDILLVVGLELALNSWLVLLAFVPLLFSLRQARAEETVLSKSFPEYDRYRRRTKMFIPFFV